MNKEFVLSMLMKIGFKEKFIMWIKTCICNPSFSTLMNVHPSPTFPSSRGLRQGDALSPLLFIIAMESLTILLDYAEIEGKIFGLGKKDHLVNHILFEDDLMLFLKANNHFI